MLSIIAWQRSFIASPRSLPFAFNRHRQYSSDIRPGTAAAVAQTNLNRLLLKMPRPNKTAHIADAQKQRLRIKEKAARYPPGTASLQILGSGAAGSPASVYLFTDQSRYLFNCGEGTQRLAHEHKTKLSRLEHIFVTRTSWTRIGGLPGLSLTVQDAGVPSLQLHGPPGLDELFRAMRRFVVLKDLRVQAPELSGDAPEPFEDSVLTVNYVPLRRCTRTPDSSRSGSPVSASGHDDDTDYYAHETRSPPRCASADDAPTGSGQCSAANGSESLVMAYQCQLKPRPGALSLGKCVDLGVPAGPLLGQLKCGQSVTLADGRVVHARDVCAPDDPGPVFGVLDVPSVEYLDALEANADRFCARGRDGARPVLIVHCSPAAVVEHPAYRRFMERYPSGETMHLMLNETNRFSGYVAAHRIQCQLNQISEHVFPMLKESPGLIADDSDSPSKRCRRDSLAADAERQPEPVSGDEARIEGAGSLTHYHLRPLRGLDRSQEPMLQPDEYRAETLNFDGFAESLRSIRADVGQRYGAQLAGRSDEYPRIVFLGTGSCIPNKTRNVSSILVHTSAGHCVLLDCGEGTAAQIRRFYGPDEYEAVLRRLGAIYVSHLHADHHIGLIGVLQERRRALGVQRAEPVRLLAPVQMTSWLHFYDKHIEALRHEYELVANGDLLDRPLDDQRTQAMGITAIRTCLVRHCPHSFGVAIECRTQRGEPFKLTYSGDTMPCDELIALGRDSTVLIHEATMEDELAEQARYKMHSTVSQAIEQGRRMGARHTLLTHFSQRYAKLPRIERRDGAIGGDVFIAFDNMEVTLADLAYVSRMLPTMQLMFTDHCDEMEQKALKRAFKAERAMEAAVLAK